MDLETLLSPGKSRYRVHIAVAFVLLVLILFGAFSEHSKPSRSTGLSSSWHFDPERDQRNLGLSDEQCDLAFPGLYAEIDRARQYYEEAGGINLTEIKLVVNEPGLVHAQTRVLLYNGNLYVVGDKIGTAQRERIGYALSNLYRAISSIPDPRVLPNIEFNIDTGDVPRGGPSDKMPKQAVWAWDRYHKDNSTWVMPDFDGWSYIGANMQGDVGGYGPFRERIAEIEKNQTFEKKIPKVLWRGTAHLSNGDVPHLRQDLIAAAEGKEWSDVEAGHFVTQGEHCNWQYLVATEGYAWGGRMRYLKNCNSVTIIHQPLHFIAHFYPLLRAEGPDQNFIPVKSDWSDLDEKMQHYLTHPTEAATIAKNSVDVFRDRYLTPAAEACYQRRMIREYAKVQNFEPQLWKEEVKEDGKVVRKTRGFDWELWSYMAPCTGPPNPGHPKDQVEFEDI